MVAVHKDGKIYPELRISSGGVEFGRAAIEARRDMALMQQEALTARVQRLEGATEELERILTEIAVPALSYAQQATGDAYFGFQLRAIDRRLHDTLQLTNGPEGGRCEAAAREDSEDRNDAPGSDSSESG